MIHIDGSFGEGGGQILRSSLALSLVTGIPFKIENIRARRKKPGLLRQHLTAATAAARIGCAEIRGDSIGSMSISFSPRDVVCANARFSVGTAGSCTLVLQTVLPAIMLSGKSCKLILEGGTHNPFAPPFDFIEKAFLPIIEKMGPRFDAVLERPGYYPAGGGRFRISIEGVDQLKPLEITKRGEIFHKNAYAKVSKIPVSIAHRQLKVVRDELSLERSCLKAVEDKDSIGPGNILNVVIESEHITEVFTGFGERGVSAEKVASKIVKKVKEYMDADTPVGEYLADQLLIPMALSKAGKFRTISPSRHTTTNIEVIKKFLDVDIRTERINEKIWEIEIISKET
jgi:RNA 3'-terminal phosphate cyclase (ATP)